MSKSSPEVACPVRVDKAAGTARIVAALESILNCLSDAEFNRLFEAGNEDWLVSELQRGCHRVARKSDVRPSGIRG